MKELSIEQKAKRYDEAIKKAEPLYKAAEPMSGCNVIIETLFPELAESENERIRKALINGFNKLDKSAVWYNGITNGQILAWLEKQGKNNMGISESTKQKLEDNLNKALEKETPESWNEFLDEQGEQKPAWSEEDDQYLLVCKNALVKYQTTDKWDASIIYRWLVNKLKSLRPQPQWKPSDEQMDNK